MNNKINNTNNTNNNISNPYTANQISRNLASVRVDKITKLTMERTKGLPDGTSLHITIICSNDENAYLSGNEEIVRV